MSTEQTSENIFTYVFLDVATFTGEVRFIYMFSKMV